MLKIIVGFYKKITSQIEDQNLDKLCFSRVYFFNSYIISLILNNYYNKYCLSTK